MSQRNGGGNGGSGTSDGPPSPLDGLAGGAASADADTASMPPPPPRRKQPLQSSLNPLLVGATVVSASVPPLQSVNNVRCKEMLSVRGEKRGASSYLEFEKKNEKNRATLRPQPRRLFSFNLQSSGLLLLPRWPSAAAGGGSLSRRASRRSSGFVGPGSGKVSSSV